MRKYKAWDKVNKKMIEDVASIHFKAEMIATSNLCFYPFKDIELLQSTGLFDKNGKEIFEGHILNYRDEYRVVEMYDGAWISRTGEKRLIVKMAVLSGAKIIGNKFENRELLDYDSSE